MNKRPRASLLLTPAFAGRGLSAQEKNQLFLAIIPRMRKINPSCLQPSNVIVLAAFYDGRTCDDRSINARIRD